MATFALRYTRPDWESAKIRGWKQLGNYTWSTTLGLINESSKSSCETMRKTQLSGGGYTEIVMRVTSHPNSCHGTKTVSFPFYLVGINPWPQRVPRQLSLRQLPGMAMEASDFCAVCWNMLLRLYHPPRDSDWNIMMCFMLYADVCDGFD